MFIIWISVAAIAAISVIATVSLMMAHRNQHEKTVALKESFDHYLESVSSLSRREFDKYMTHSAEVYEAAGIPFRRAKRKEDAILKRLDIAASIVFFSVVFSLIGAIAEFIRLFI